MVEWTDEPLCVFLVAFLRDFFFPDALVDQGYFFGWMPRGQIMGFRTDGSVGSVGSA